MLPVWAFILFYSYGIPLILLYSMIIYVLLTRKNKFTSTFYTFVAIFGIQDIIGYLNAQYILRAPLSEYMYSTYFYSLETAYQRYPVVFIFIRFATELNGIIGSVILALNRITAMLYPIKHNEIWKKYLFRILIAYFVTPFVLYGFVLFNWGKLECARTQEHVVVGCFINYDRSFLLYGLAIIDINQVLFIVIPVLSGILNCVSLVLLYSRKKTLKSQRTWSQEINLSLSTSAVFFSHIVYGVLTKSILIRYREMDMELITFLIGFVIPLIQDGAILIMVVNLLISSKPLRIEVTKLTMKPWRTTPMLSSVSVTFTKPFNTRV